MRNGRETRLLRLSSRGGRRRSPRPRHADEVPDRPGHPGLHVARLRRVVVSIPEVLDEMIWRSCVGAPGTGCHLKYALGGVRES